MEEVEHAIDILTETCRNAGILITSTTASSDSTTPKTSAMGGSSMKRRHGAIKSTSTALHLSATRPHVIIPHPLISISLPEHEESRLLSTFPNVPETAANISPNTEALTPSSPSIKDGFYAARLEKAPSLRADGAKGERYFKTLQCIREAGSSQILSSLKAATSTQANIKNADSLTKTPGYTDVDRLFCIHRFLENQDVASHIAIARSRYVRLLYYQTYESAVASLSVSLRNRRVETSRISAIKHIVKQDILQRIQGYYDHPSPEDKRRIKRNMTVFLKQGKNIHLILQGFYLSPGGQVRDGGGEEAGTEPYASCAALLLFLPGKTKTSPDVSSCVKDEVVRRRLQKGIQVQE
ncbi:hypothetical protein EJ02DRAFT_469137 [Clathrospora elynae]|uniref:Uncharacterized protein n=1 Tax=Clathrospora elynae TaxID=706981 RepID=A0A6A5SFF3_9PLEO|nr:hypothetical protein EJ02DRAFT_469137 [Clathrospora elynae]